MAVLLNIGELNGLRNPISNVNQESQNSLTMNSIIGDFNTGGIGNVLKGEIWNSEGQKLEQYMNALKKSSAMADKISMTINNAMGALAGAWDSRFGESIDDAYRDQIDRELTAAEAELASLEAQELDTTAARNLVNELRSLLSAIDNFLAVYSQQISALDSVMSDLGGDFGTTVKGITATAAWSFTPY